LAAAILVAGIVFGESPVEIGVTEIRDLAFKGCTGLTKIEIPVNVAKIEIWETFTL